MLNIFRKLLFKVKTRDGNRFEFSGIFHVPSHGVMLKEDGILKETSNRIWDGVRFPLIYLVPLECEFTLLPFIHKILFLDRVHSKSLFFSLIYLR